MIGVSEGTEHVTQAQKKMLRLAVELGIKIPGHEPAPTPAAHGETAAQREKREAAAAAGAGRVAAYRAQLDYHFGRISAVFEEAQIQGFTTAKAAQFKK